MDRLPFVWELNRDGVISHAVGAFHYSPVDYSEAAKELMDGKSSALTEVGTAQPSEGFVIRMMQDTAGKYLDQLEPDEQEAFVRYMGKEREHLDKTPVCFLTESHMALANIPYVGSVDGAITTAAQGHGVPIIGLETLTEQEPVLELSRGGLVGNLRKIARQEMEREGSTSEHFQATYAALTAGDGDAYMSLNHLSPPLISQLTERDIRFSQRALPYLESPSVFAIGVMHFLREGSVLDLLQKEGVGVRRIW